MSRAAALPLFGLFLLLCAVASVEGVRAQPAGDAEPAPLTGAEVYRRAVVATGIVQLDGEGQVGTGFVFDARGLVLTCYHLFRDPVRLGGARFLIPRGVPDGRTPPRELRARLVAIDGRRDLAVLDLECRDAIPVLPLAPDGSIEVGEAVYTIGNPGMGETDLPFTLSSGIISFRHRFFGGTRHLQSDVAINAGSSGGPLVDRFGRAVGVIALQGGGQEGLAFAVAVEEVRGILEVVGKPIEPDVDDLRRAARRWLTLVADGRDDAAAAEIATYYWHDQDDLYGEIVDYVDEETDLQTREGYGPDEIESYLDERMRDRYGVPHSSRLVRERLERVNGPAIRGYLMALLRKRVGRWRGVALGEIRTEGAQADVEIAVGDERVTLRWIRDGGEWRVVPLLPP